MNKLYKDYLMYVDREIAQIIGMVEDIQRDARAYCKENNAGMDVFEAMCDSTWTEAHGMLIQVYNMAYERGCEVEDLNELFEGTGI